MRQFVKSGFAAAALLGAAVSGAAAADLPVFKAPPPEVIVYNWTGIYGGVDAGFAWGDIERRYLAGPIPGAGPSPGFTARHRFNDGVGSLHFGAQWQFGGGWILGGEFGLLEGFNHLRTDRWTDPRFPAGIRGVDDLAYVITLGPRLGYGWGPAMLFVTGGWAVGGTTSRYVNAAGADALVPFWGSARHRDGWFVGVGGEYIILKGNWADLIVGAEYKHVELDWQRATNDALVPAGLRFDTRAHADVVTARLTVKINPWGNLPVVAKY